MECVGERPPLSICRALSPRGNNLRVILRPIELNLGILTENSPSASRRARAHGIPSVSKCHVLEGLTPFKFHVDANQWHRRYDGIVIFAHVLDIKSAPMRCFMFQYSTGVPNISIPIHTLHNGNINVPIALRYHPGAVRVSQHPGWVGLGWDLEAGGVITRQEREFPDEMLVNNGNPSGLASTYYPLSVYPSGFSGSELINNNSGWNSSSTFPTFFEANGQGNVPDVCADEFSGRIGTPFRFLPNF